MNVWESTDMEHTAFASNQTADTRSPAQRKRDAARNFIELIKDPIISGALSGKMTRDGHDYDSYLLASVDSTTPPKGLQMLVALSEGKPIHPQELSDLMLGIRETLLAYNQQIDKTHELAMAERNEHFRTNNPQAPSHRLSDVPDTSAELALREAKMKTNDVILAAQTVLGTARTL